MQLDMSWMAWTWQTAAFFAAIAGILLAMSVLALLRPPVPRPGALGIETTPGDRVFLSLLASAYLCLIALYVFGPPLWWALLASAALSAAIFRWI